MNRVEYIKQLEFLLQDMPENEREEALEYYRDYFDDAGTLEEANVIATLGSPERVAAMIKDGLSGQNEEAGEYTDSGYVDERFREDHNVPEPRTGSENQTQNGKSSGSEHSYRRQYSQGQYQRDRAGQGSYGQSGYQRSYDSGNGYSRNYEDGKQQTSGNNTGKILLIIVLCIFAIPVIIPVAGGLFGGAVGIFGGLFGLAIAVFGGCFGLAAGGIGMIGSGIAKLFVSVPSGLVTIGGGLLLLALGALLVLLAVFLAGKFIPWFIRFVTGILSRIFRRRGNR